MSLFVNPYGAQELNQARLDVAEVQFDAMTTTFNTLLAACREKCVPHDGYGEPDLTRAELSCADRCIAKAHAANRAIGTYVQARGLAPHRALPHYAAFAPRDR
ncbi:ADL311Wp [Eremothecium gossypii ATCC 10895]|uniref:Mitochondrial import inner membrane translocase subunit n=1 Tax=Eremothecium gossypii (strain ATCC 10895 / CBS 109.51 / FGSC 9923 / NRRL Y-1056) TaxID=284811 RepID=Q75B83_EREGS|nr:ADL311Wp [Eremothecium gossypii ATCC 10895]AAS51609.2 ADL311Wp [Eremothecium gossypii ATCC 10895]AEY95905.1 FADL311Wp [Eremothecium gossypii FDAG1]